MILIILLMRIIKNKLKQIIQCQFMLRCMLSFLLIIAYIHKLVHTTISDFLST